jgi:predicted Fe-Mo cluster-binding NifX family protein
MKLAVATWKGRVSPVLDASRQLLLLEVGNGKIVSSGEQHEIGSEEPLLKAARLAELGVEALICGAVSRPLAEMIAARGIRLVSFVAGETEEVLAAYLAGNLPSPALAMPGCRGRRMRFQHGRGRRACRRGSDGW